MIEERIFSWAAGCRYSYKPQANGIVRATWQSDEFKKSRKDWQVYGANCEANRFLFLADKIRTAYQKNRTRILKLWSGHP
jgi:hypothetical protein